MAKITLPTIAAGYASNAAFNTAFGQIDAEFQSKVLYRDNPSGEPNTMQNLLDMNSNPINNVTMLTATGITVAGVNLTAKVAEAAASATAAAASAAAAVVSKNAAAASATAAEGYVDTFDDKYLGSKSSAPTVDNDGNALTDGALYFNTSSNIMFVYDLGTTAWLQLTLTTSNQNNVNTVAGIASNVTTVAGISANVTTVAGIASNVTSVAGNASNINTVAGAISNVNAVGSNIANVNSVAGNATNINTVAADASDIGAVAGKATEIGRLGTSEAVADMALLGTSAVVADLALLGTSANVTAMGHLGTSANVTAMGLLGTSANVTNMATLGASGVVTNISTVATNVAGVNSFADLYRGAAGSDPSGTITTGSLYYNTALSPKQLKIYDGSNWVTAAFDASGSVTAFNGRTGSVTLANADVLTALATGAILTAKLADDAVTTVKILNANVTTDKIADDAVTAAKLANSINSEIAANTAKTGITTSQANAITANTAKTGITTSQANAITANTAKVTNATHSGDVTGSGALTIANDAVTKAKVNFISDGTAGVEVKGDGSSQDGYIQLNCSQNSHGVKIKSPPHAAGASYTLTLPNNDGDADQVLKTNGSGVTSWGTVSSVPSAVKQTFTLASGKSVTAGRGVSINAATGEVGALPVLNTFGSEVTAASASIVNTYYSSDRSRTVQIISDTIVANQDGNRTIVMRGNALSNEGVYTYGPNTITIEVPYQWGQHFQQAGAFRPTSDPSKFVAFYFVMGQRNSNYNRGVGKVMVISVAANGTISKGTEYTYDSGVRNGGWGANGFIAFSQISDDNFVMKIDMQQGTSANYIIKKSVVRSGDSLTFTDYTPVDDWAGCGGVFVDSDTNVCQMTTGNIIVRANSKYIKTAPFSSGVPGSITNTLVVSDAKTTGGVSWAPMTPIHWIARYVNPAGQSIFETYTINPANGAFTSSSQYVFGSTVGLPAGQDDFLHWGNLKPGLRATAAAQTIVRTVGTGYNTMSLDSNSQILGFNVGANNGLAGTGNHTISKPQGGTKIQYSYTRGGYYRTQEAVINAATTTPYIHVGFASATSSSGDQAITVAGVATGFSGLEEGKVYYTNDGYTGEVTTATVSANKVGMAISETEILLNRSKKNE